MIRAVARKRIPRAIVRDANVAHLGMQPAVQQAAIDQCASAHAGAHGDIDEIPQAARSAPTGFGQRRGVYIRIKRDWDPQRAHGARRSRSSSSRVSAWK